MNTKAKVHPVLQWQSDLGPRGCPYQNPFAPARWFFWLRLREAVRAADSPNLGHALEIGCWEGFFLPTLLLHYARVTAIDDDSCSLVERIPQRWTTLQAARELCVRERENIDGLSLLKANAINLPFRNASFDAVFCMDTLPFVPSNEKAVLVSEIRRVLRPGCPAVFTLPIELGPGLLLREALRGILGTWRDNYSVHELFRATLGNPVKIDARSDRTSLIGYDYRLDERLILSAFSLKKRKFLPSNFFRWMSPTVLLCCRTER
jgi:SAM-dependent methyltransferase